jgi:hypothetical protein
LPDFREVFFSGLFEAVFEDAQLGFLDVVCVRWGWDGVVDEGEY